MGAHGNSARVSYSLWRAVLSRNNAYNAPKCSKSTRLTSLELADLPCYIQPSSRAQHLQTSAAGSVTAGGGNFISAGRLSLHHRRTIPEHGTSGVKAFDWERQFVKRISSHSCVNMCCKEDTETKLSDDLEDEVEDVIVEGPHDESISEILTPEQLAERKIRREALWRKLEKFQKIADQTVKHIESYIAEGRPFTKSDASFFISRLRRFGRYRQATEISDWMAESKIFPWTETDQAIRLSLKGKLGLSAEVERIFNTSPPELQTQTTYNTVIEHFCSHRMARKAREWLESLIKSGCLTQPFAFNRLIVLFKERNDSDKIAEVLDLMTKAGVSRDVYTYNILMAERSKHNDVAGVEAIFEEGKADPNVEPDAAICATLASCYIHAGLKEKAAAALEECERRGFARTGNTDEVVVTLWSKLQNKEKVLQMWERIKERANVAARTYIVMIETFGRLGMLEQSENLFDEMKQKNGSVRPRQFTALLSAYVKNEKMDKVEMLIGKLDEMGLKKNASLNHHLVGMYLKLGLLEKAQAVVSEARRKGGFPVWSKTMSTLLDAVAKTGDVIEAEKIFESMLSVYKQKSVTIYNTLLKAYVNAKLPAEGFLERMAADNITPNAETQELLSSYSGNKSTDSASVSVPAEVALSS